jgi:superfamily II DNA or RNA helicase
MPHQETVVKWLDKNRGLIAVHQTGAGKTLTAVTASQCFLDKYPDRYVVVVAPVTLLPNFQKEMKTYGINPKDKRYLFFSYEKFYNLKDHHKVCSNNMLIVDEAHELRSDIFAAKQRKEKEKERQREKIRGIEIEYQEELGPEFYNRAHKIIDCTKQAERVLLMTATPFVNTTYDVANLLAMVKAEDPIDPKQWYVSSRRFENILHYYDVPKNKANQYPDVHIKQEFIEMDDTFYSQYRQIEEDLEFDLPNVELTNSDAFIIRLRQALLRIPDSGKINYTIDHIKNTLKRKPNARMVVYSNFIESGVINIGILLEKYEISYGLISGNVPEKQRQIIINEYNAGKLSVLLISKAAQRGIDLKETTSMIVLDVPWNPASLEQAIGRVARYQSHNRLPEKEQKVDIYILYSIFPGTSHIKRYVRLSSREGSWWEPQHPSADMMMKWYIDSKVENSKKFTEFMKSVSI